MKRTLTLILVGAILGSTVAFAASKFFSDVPANTWYTDAVNSLSSKGIINGYPDGTFGPTKNVNRAELAVILDRLINYLKAACSKSGQDGFIMFDGNCYTVGENVLDTDCIVSSAGGCKSLDEL